MLSPRDAWQATLGQLQLQLNRATYDTWLKGSELAAYEDGEFVIRVRHAYAKDWIEKHLHPLITQTLGNTFGRSVRASFIVHTPQPKPSPSSAGPLWASRAVSDEDDDDVLPDYSEWAPSKAASRTPAEPAPQIPLNRRYTFDEFVVGPGNQFAYAAAKAVAETPAGPYNPLVLYSEVGLGKTHLLQAIGHACKAGGRRMAYVTAETFTNELVAAIRARKTEEFRERYRCLDVLLLDDIQFIAGKTSTEEELYHTFNAILAHDGQIVVASDRHPRAISSLDERLRSRFEGGLLADIQPPDLETRLAILEKKAAAQGVALPAEVAHQIARHAERNVRELEGLLTQVTARATLSKQPITVQMVQHMIDKNNVTSSIPARRSANLDQVLKATATYHQLSLDDLLSKRRTKEIVRARHVAIYLAREETDLSFPAIGEALGGRNHSTVVHGYQKIADEIESDDDLREELSSIRRQLYPLSPN